MINPLQSLAQGATPRPSAELALFKPGQVLEAVVIGRLPDGTTALKIGDAVIAAQLPQQLPPGTTLQLQVKVAGPAPQLALVGSPRLPITTIPAPQMPLPPVAQSVTLQVGAPIASQPLPNVAAPPAPTAQSPTSLQPPSAVTPSVARIPSSPPPAAAPAGLAGPSPTLPSPAATSAPASVPVQSAPVPAGPASSTPPPPSSQPKPLVSQATVATSSAQAPATPLPPVVAVVGNRESAQTLATTSAPIAATPLTSSTAPPAPPLAAAPAASVLARSTPVAQSAPQPTAPPSTPAAASTPTHPSPATGTGLPTPAPRASSPPTTSPSPAVGTSAQPAIASAVVSPQPAPPLIALPQSPAPAPVVSSGNQQSARTAGAPISPPTAAVATSVPTSSPVVPSPTTIAQPAIAPSLAGASPPASLHAPATPAPQAAAPEAVSPNPLLVAQSSPRAQPTATVFARTLPPSTTPTAASPAPPATPAAALAQMVPEALARQNAITPLLASLAAVVGKPGVLPEPVLRAALQVLGQRVQLPQNGPTGDLLKTAIEKSGVFLEAGLAKAGNPTADMKSALVALRSSLATWLGGNPAPVQAAQPVAPPLRGVPPRAEQPDLAPLPEPGRETARALHHQADAALSRVKLMQLASLPDADPARPAPPELRMEVPFLLGGETVLAQFQIFRDGSRRRTDGKRGWTMRFAMNLATTGEVGAEVGLLGKSVSVALWAAEREMHDRMEAALPELAPALAALGLDPGAVRLRAAPPEPEAPPSGRYLDSLT